MSTHDREEPKPNNQVVLVGTAHLFISPVGFLLYASQFLDAARATERQKYFSPVPYYLYCRSIELSLKAFLLSKGVQRDNLKHRSLGHDLEKIWARACAFGIRDIVHVSLDQEACLKQANRYYRTKGFEYFEVSLAVRGYKGLPALDVLDSLSDLLMIELRPCCADVLDNPPQPPIATQLKGPS